MRTLNKPWSTMTKEEKYEWLEDEADEAVKISHELSALVDSEKFPEDLKQYTYWVIHELRATARAVRYGIKKDAMHEEYYDFNRRMCSGFINHAEILMELVKLKTGTDHPYDRKRNWLEKSVHTRIFR